MRCGSNRLPPTHPPVHPPLLACLWEISVPASAETAERRNGQVSFVFWHCAVGWDREFESAFLQRRVCELSVPLEMSDSDRLKPASRNILSYASRPIPLITSRHTSG